MCKLLYYCYYYVYWYLETQYIKIYNNNGKLSVIIYTCIGFERGKNNVILKYILENYVLNYKINNVFILPKVL